MEKQWEQWQTLFFWAPKSLQMVTAAMKLKLKAMTNLDSSRQEKGTTEDEMVGWQHQCDRHEFEQVLGADDGQGSLACCSPRGHKQSDMTEWLNWTESSKKGFWQTSALPWHSDYNLMEFKSLIVKVKVLVCSIMSNSLQPLWTIVH